MNNEHGLEDWPGHGCLCCVGGNVLECNKSQSVWPLCFECCAPKTELISIADARAFKWNLVVYLLPYVSV